MRLSAKSCSQPFCVSTRNQVAKNPRRGVNRPLISTCRKNTVTAHRADARWRGFLMTLPNRTKPFRTTYTEIVADLADALADRIDLKGREKRKAALATVATCVGAMAIARAVSNEDLVDELFDAGRWATRRMAFPHSSRRP